MINLWIDSTVLVIKNQNCICLNIMIYWKNKEGEVELVTPPIEQGVILPGVTRDSLLTLAREWNEFKVTERPVTMNELVEALDEGRVLEGKLAVIKFSISKNFYSFWCWYRLCCLPSKSCDIW